MTIKDIAARAGVSICTVSRVLNKKALDRVSPATRQRVLQVARELNYRPNWQARGLVRRRSWLVGLIIPGIGYGLMGDLLQGIQDRAEALGYGLLSHSSFGNPQREAACFRSLRDKRVDGIIWLPPRPENEGLVRELMAEIPLLQGFRRLSGLEAPYVILDNVAGGFKATEHLLKLGHRRIAHLAAGVGEEGEERLEGYRRALAAYGVPFAPELVVVGSFSWFTGYWATASLWERGFFQGKEPITAIFACADMTAWGAVQFLREHGVAVPEQVAVMGFDDLPVSAMMEVPLSTVAQPGREIGALIMDSLHNLIEERPEKVRNIVLDPHLVIRQSCGANPQFRREYLAGMRERSGS